ncbi:HET-domain-containing protein, partial [Westerdykella ornata]
MSTIQLRELVECCTAISECEPGELAFVHTPLNDPAKEIRIATIYPSASIDSPVLCGLSTFTLSTAPDYEALSYCWGDENDSRPIFLRGRPYRVTTNLFSALRQLRRAETERRIWIDSICINQSSHHEKNHQIPLMGDIYKRAKQVVAWLGDSDEETRIALDLLTDWTATTKRLSDYRPPSWDALCNLLERPYWTRLWALQECVLA